ncbi:MAG: heavy metal sensor histidine kinase [Planctomycetota bacterium]|nr:heavy metal sensor histidine kinase [Planctomycetota bacterium]
MKAVSIRWRLTLWYGIVLVALMCGFGIAIYSLMSDAIVRQADAEIDEELGEFQNELQAADTRAAVDASLQTFFDLHPDYLFEASLADGSRLISPIDLSESIIPSAQESIAAVNEHLSRSVDHRGRFRIGNQSVSGNNGTLRIALAIPLEPYERLLHQFLRIALMAGPAVLFCSIAAGYAMACKALSPVEEMRVTAERITAENLSERISTVNPHDELGRLAATFNGMLTRLDISFQELRVFTSDAAHELRTPLAVLRSSLEVALRADRSPERYREVLHDVAEDVEKMCTLADRLLILSREDAGLLLVPDTPVPLNETLQEVINSMQGIAAERILVYQACPQSEAIVKGDADRLRQVWMNLIDNAIQFTASGGQITVRTEVVDGIVRVIVQDSGHGIEVEHLSRVFDRFYRADLARNGSHGGAGLGLAICKSIVTAHGGDIHIESFPNSGTKVTVTLPCSA